MAKNNEKKNQEKKKGISGKMFEIKREKSALSCCNVQFEEIPKDEEQELKEKDNR